MLKFLKCSCFTSDLSCAGCSLSQQLETCQLDVILPLGERISGDICGCHKWLGVGVLLTSRGVEARDAAAHPPVSRTASRTQTMQPSKSVVPRLGTPSLERPLSHWPVNLIQQVPTQNASSEAFLTSWSRPGSAHTICLSLEPFHTGHEALLPDSIFASWIPPGRVCAAFVH